MGCPILINHRLVMTYIVIVMPFLYYLSMICVNLLHLWIIMPIVIVMRGSEMLLVDGLITSERMVHIDMLMISMLDRMHG